MTRSINRQARARMRREGKFVVIDGGKTLVERKPHRLTELTIVIEDDLRAPIEALHGFVGERYPSRNDFLVDLLKEGLRSAIAAQREALLALKKQQEEEAQKVKVPESLVELVPVMPRSLNEYVGTRTTEPK